MPELRIPLKDIVPDFEKETDLSSLTIVCAIPWGNRMMSVSEALSTRRLVLL